MFRMVQVSVRGKVQIGGGGAGDAVLGAHRRWKWGSGGSGGRVEPRRNVQCVMHTAQSTHNLWKISILWWTVVLVQQKWTFSQTICKKNKIIYIWVFLALSLDWAWALFGLVMFRSLRLTILLKRIKVQFLEEMQVKCTCDQIVWAKNSWISKETSQELRMLSRSLSVY